MDGSFYPSIREIWIGTGGSLDASYTGLRFSNLQIPQGASISSAHLEVYTPRNTWIEVDLSMAAEAIDDSPTFSPDIRPSQRVRTTQQVIHSSDDNWRANNWYALDDIALVIQEVVDRPGWQSGGSLALILQGIGAKWGRKFVTSYEGDPAHAPRLVINYSTPTDTVAATEETSVQPQLLAASAPSLLRAGSYEETQPEIQYAGVWNVYSGSEASGGAVNYTNDPNATISFQFEGTGVLLYLSKRADSGQKVICIDDACQLVDLHIAETQWNQPTAFVGLEPGVHSVQIRNVSTAYGDLDAVRVLGAGDAAPVIVATATASATLTLTPDAVVIPTATLIPTAAATPTPAPLPFIETLTAGRGGARAGRGCWIRKTLTAARAGTPTRPRAARPARWCTVGSLTCAAQPSRSSPSGSRGSSPAPTASPSKSCRKAARAVSSLTNSTAYPARGRRARLT